MVKNGYKIILKDKDDINTCINKIRWEMKSVALNEVKKLVAKEVQDLYDLKFVECANYDKPILDLAIQRVAARTAGISLNAYNDDVFDLRTSLTVVKVEKKYFYCLLNCTNINMINYFESIENIKSYKYFIDKPEKNVSEEENVKRGEFWHNIYESGEWNPRMIGAMIQLVEQPNFENITITCNDIKDYFDDENKRIDNYLRKIVIKNKVQELIGDIKIEEIHPYILTSFFMRANDYLNSENGKREYEKIKENVEKGFGPIDIKNITV